MGKPNGRLRRQELNQLKIQRRKAARRLRLRMCMSASSRLSCARGSRVSRRRSTTHRRSACRSGARLRCIATHGSPHACGGHPQAARRTSPPRAPRAPRSPRIDLTVRPEVALSREAVKAFEDLDAVCRQLRVAHHFRCMSCAEEDRKSDGVWGAAESNASQFVLECACTRRIYKGSDVKLVN